MFDGDISDLEAALFFLLARMGGLGIRDPVELCDVDFTSSQAGATAISDAVRGSAEYDWSEHLARVQAAAASVSRCQRVQSWYNDRLYQVLDQFSKAHQWTIKCAVDGGISHWLTTFPLEHHQNLTWLLLRLEMPWP